MHIFYSNNKSPELRTYCIKEDVYITDIFLEIEKSRADNKKAKNERRKMDFKRILSIIRMDKKNYKTSIVDNECEKTAYEI